MGAGRATLVEFRPVGAQNSRAKGALQHGDRLRTAGNSPPTQAFLLRLFLLE
jgi:hypothetical protein